MSQDRTKRCIIDREPDDKRVELYYEGVVTLTSLLMDTHAKGKSMVHMDIGYIDVVEALPKAQARPLRRGA